MNLIINDGRRQSRPHLHGGIIRLATLVLLSQISIHSVKGKLRFHLKYPKRF